MTKAQTLMVLVLVSVVVSIVFSPRNILLQEYSSLIGGLDSQIDGITTFKPGSISAIVNAFRT